MLSERKGSSGSFRHWPADRSGPHASDRHRGCPKLLNMRDFRALSGFPSQPKRATIRRPQTGESIGLAYFPLARPLMPRRAIGRAKFRAYMLLTHP
jgi:hypothetical protein